jgi:predicted hotdog family 3-hydroxylacyl-ACP dehydratase
MAAAGLTLHASPMLLVDWLTEFGEDGGLVEATVRPDNILLGAGGAMESAAMAELIAQSYAVVNGYHNLLEGKPRQMGYLVGIRRMQFMQAAREGDRLEIRVRTVKDLGAFKAAEGEVRRSGKVIVRGEFKVWMPEEQRDGEAR